MRSVQEELTRSVAEGWLEPVARQAAEELCVSPIVVVLKKDQVFFALERIKDHLGELPSDLADNVDLIKDKVAQLPAAVRDVTKVKIRVCYDGSFSYNACLEGVDLAFSHEGVEVAIEKMRDDWEHMGKTDLQDFYRFFALHPVMWPYLACVHEGVVYIQKALSFGQMDGSFLSNWFSGCLGNMQEALSQIRVVWVTDDSCTSRSLLICCQQE